MGEGVLVMLEITRLKGHAARHHWDGLCHSWHDIWHCCVLQDARLEMGVV